MTSRLHGIPLLSRLVPVASRAALVLVGLAAIVGSGTGETSVGSAFDNCSLQDAQISFDSQRPDTLVTTATAVEGTPVTLHASVSVQRGNTQYGAPLDRLSTQEWQRFDSATGAWQTIRTATAFEPDYVVQDTVYSRGSQARYRVKMAFRCSLLTDTPANYFTTSGEATLTIAPGALAWVDAAQPADRVVNVGDGVTLQALARGDDTYQWQVSADGTQWGDVPQATADTLNFTALAGGTFYYRLRAQNAASGQSITSRAAQVIINVVTTTPAITQQPADQVVAAGDSAQFSVSATGGALRYQWQRSDAGAAFVDVPGATQATLVFFTSAGDTGRRVRVVVGNDKGSITSAAATLTVTQPDLPVITQQPASPTVTDFTPATFSVVATGPSLVYQWQRSDDGGTSFQDIPGANAASYSFTVDASAGDRQARFHVVVSNGTGRTTSLEVGVAITLVPPAVTSDPADATVNAGDAVSFAVGGSGSLLSYQWQLCNANGSYTDIAGATSPALSFTAVLADDGKRYRAAVIGDLQSRVFSACATLHVSGTALSITATPGSAVPILGASLPVTLRIHPISGQAGTITLTVSGVPGGTPAPLTLSPTLPLSFATSGTGDIVQVINLQIGSNWTTPYTLRFTVTEAATTADATVRVAVQYPAAGAVQVGTSSQNTTGVLDRLGPPVSPPTTPPTYVYEGRVDVGRAELGASLMSGSGTNVYAFIGTPNVLTLSNLGPGSVTLPAGAIRMDVNGSYRFATNAQLSNESTFTLTWRGSSTISASAFVVHTLTGAGAQAPSVNRSSTNAGQLATPVVTVGSYGTAGLRFVIASPALTLAPGQRVELQASVNMRLASGGGAMDFLTTPARLCVDPAVLSQLVTNAAQAAAWACP